MHARIRLITAIAVFAFAFSVSAAPPVYVPIEQRLTPAQMHDTGLDQLSPTQLSALNAILSSDVSATVKRAHAEAAQENGRAVVEGRIAGRFTGWDTGTVFTLDDGSRWQVTGGSFNTRAVDSPRVTVKPGLLSGWYMHVEGQPVVASVRRAR
ncbi:hypothetical protein [Cognatilysobacter terrigena]|uniref:hypothetical protein n=1 Tax=Cognatilysobacter terrigena TaxID=2488749 RepID=UPI00105B4E74|nr:hypothetical protein [Lysobacter terrigena]